MARSTGPARLGRGRCSDSGEDEVFAFDCAARDFGYAPRGYREGLADEVRRLRETGFIR